MWNQVSTTNPSSESGENRTETSHAPSEVSQDEKCHDPAILEHYTGGYTVSRAIGGPRNEATGKYFGAKLNFKPKYKIKNKKFILVDSVLYRMNILKLVKSVSADL